MASIKKKAELSTLHVIPELSETDDINNDSQVRKRPERVRQYSDAALFYMDPDRVHPTRRRRQLSSSDALRKMNNPPILIDYSDLKMAEELTKTKLEAISKKDEDSVQEPVIEENQSVERDDFEKVENVENGGTKSLNNKREEVFAVEKKGLREPACCIVL